MKKILTTIIIAVAMVWQASAASEFLVRKMSPFTNQLTGANGTTLGYYVTNNVIDGTERGRAWGSFMLNVEYSAPSLLSGSTNLLRGTIEKSTDKVNWYTAHHLVDVVTTGWGNSNKSVTVYVPFNGFPYYRVSELKFYYPCSWTNTSGLARGYLTNIAATYTLLEEKIPFTHPRVETPSYLWNSGDGFGGYVRGMQALTNKANPGTIIAFDATGWSAVSVSVGAESHTIGTNDLVVSLSRSRLGTFATLEDYAELGERIVIKRNNAVVGVAAPVPLAAAYGKHLSETGVFSVGSMPWFDICNVANLDSTSAFTNVWSSFSLIK